MTRQGIASLAIKLMATFCLLQAIPFLLGILPLLGSAGSDLDAETIAQECVIVVALAVFYLLVIRWGDPLARRLVPEETQEPVVTSLDSDGVATIAFACMGLYLAGTALAGLAGVAINYTVMLRAEHYTFSANMLQAGVVPFVTMLVGLALFFGARGLAHVWNKARTAGRPVAAPQETEGL